MTFHQIPISNIVNAGFMLVLIAGALFRLTDGRRESYIEKSGLMAIAIGAFFQLAKIHDPAGTSPDLLLFRFGVVCLVMYYSIVYVVKKIDSNEP